MTKYSTLSLDLNHVSDAQRKAAYAELEKEKWTKMQPTTTLWYASWADGTTDDAIIATTKKDVATAAKAGRVTNYDATMSIGTKPVSWKAPVVI